MPFWEKFKPRKRNQRETHQSTLQEPQTPPPQRPAPREEVPSRELLRYATNEAQQHVDQKYPHRTLFEIISHILSLLRPIEKTALKQGLLKEMFEAWFQELKPQLSSPSLTLERAEVASQLLTDALKKAHEHPIVEVVKGRRELISELAVTNLFSSRNTLNGASELAVKNGMSKIYSAFFESARNDQERNELHYWSVSLDGALKEYLKEKKISNFVLKALEYDMEVLRILAERCPLVDGQTHTIVPFFAAHAVMQRIRSHVESEHSEREGFNTF